MERFINILLNILLLCIPLIIKVIQSKRNLQLDINYQESIQKIINEIKERQ